MDNPPVGSRIGAHWTNVPDESVLQVFAGDAVLDVVSVLEAAPGKQLCACSGAALRDARDHRGDGFVDDQRPLVVLDDARGRTQADLIAADRGQFGSATTAGSRPWSVAQEPTAASHAEGSTRRRPRGMPTKHTVAACITRSLQSHDVPAPP